MGRRLAMGCNPTASCAAEPVGVGVDADRFPIGMAGPSRHRAHTVRRRLSGHSGFRVNKPIVCQRPVSDCVCYCAATFYNIHHKIFGMDKRDEICFTTGACFGCGMTPRRRQGAWAARSRRPETDAGAFQMKKPPRSASCRHSVRGRLPGLAHDRRAYDGKGDIQRVDVSASGESRG